MTPLEAFFLVGGLVFIILWVYELYESRKLRSTYRAAEETAENFIDGFTELKNVINTNANTLRSLRSVVDRHDKTLAIQDALIDVHAQALSIQPNLKTMLESEVISGHEIEDTDGTDSGQDQ